MSPTLKLPPTASPNPSLSGSLLDDDDDDETAKLDAAVLQPVTSPSPVMTPTAKMGMETTKEKMEGDFDDEEWNW